MPSSKLSLAYVVLDCIRRRGPVTAYMVAAGCELVITPEKAARYYMKSRDRLGTRYRRTEDYAEQVRLGRRILVLHTICGLHASRRIIRTGRCREGRKSLSLWKVNMNGKKENQT